MLQGLLGAAKNLCGICTNEFPAISGNFRDVPEIPSEPLLFDIFFALNRTLRNPRTRDQWNVRPGPGESILIYFRCGRFPIEVELIFREIQFPP